MTTVVLADVVLFVLVENVSIQHDDVSVHPCFDHALLLLGEHGIRCSCGVGMQRFFDLDLLCWEPAGGILVIQRTPVDCGINTHQRIERCDGPVGTE